MFPPAPGLCAFVKLPQFSIGLFTPGFWHAVLVPYRIQTIPFTTPSFSPLYLITAEQGHTCHGTVGVGNPFIQGFTAREQKRARWWRRNKSPQTIDSYEQTSGKGTSILLKEGPLHYGVSGQVATNPNGYFFFAVCLYNRWRS